MYAATLLITAFAGCGRTGYEKAENAQDAGRQFIRASLDGDHKKARFYLLKDTTNLLLIERQQRDYEGLTTDEKREHRQSSIRPISIRDINDSITTYKYINTYNPKRHHDDYNNQIGWSMAGRFEIDFETIIFSVPGDSDRGRPGILGISPIFRG